MCVPWPRWRWMRDANSCLGSITSAYYVKYGAICDVCAHHTSPSHKWAYRHTHYTIHMSWNERYKGGITRFPPCKNDVSTFAQNCICWRQFRKELMQEKWSQSSASDCGSRVITYKLSKWRQLSVIDSLLLILCNLSLHPVSMCSSNLALPTNTIDQPQSPRQLSTPHTLRMPNRYFEICEWFIAWNNRRSQWKPHTSPRY